MKDLPLIICLAVCLLCGLEVGYVWGQHNGEAAGFAAGQLVCGKVQRVVIDVRPVPGLKPLTFTVRGGEIVLDTPK